MPVGQVTLMWIASICRGITKWGKRKRNAAGSPFTQAEVEQEDDRCTARSERERIRNRVASEWPEQSRLRWRWIGAPDTN